MYDNHSNCYTLHSKGINGKRIGEWSNNAQIAENNNHLEVIQQSLNEYVKYLGSTNIITLEIDSSTGKYKFKVGEEETAENPVTFTDTNGKNTYNILYKDNNIIIYHSIPKIITYKDTPPIVDGDIINAWLYYLGYTGSSLKFIYNNDNSNWIPPEDFGNSGISYKANNKYIILKNADEKTSYKIDGSKTDYTWGNVADIYLKAFGYNNDKNKCSYDSENGWTIPTNLINNKILALTDEDSANILNIHKILFTIDTSKENPEIIEDTISSIKDKVEENKENEIKKSATNAFNTALSVFTSNTISGNTILNVVNNGIQGIESSLISKFMKILCSNTNIKTLSLVCTGKARWDWEKCATTFKITSLKYTIGEIDKELIHHKITIKKEYSNEPDAKNDITKNDILVELLKNNKLFKKINGKKMFFNNVDLSGIKYYAFISKYINNTNADIYCLKCALMHQTYDYSLGQYSYEPEEFSMTDNWHYNCYKHKSTLNAYDKKGKYKFQLQILDNAANGKDNRIISSYYHYIAQKLCTLEHLKDGWKNQSA